MKAEGDRGHIRTRISGYVSAFPVMPQGLELAYKILQIHKFSKLPLIYLFLTS